MRTNPESSRGIALVAVLWAVMLLSVITMSFLHETRTDAQLTHNLMDNAEARALADGAVHRAIARLLEQRTNTDAVFDGRPTTIPATDATVEISIQDEAGKVNLNTAPDELIESVLLSGGLSMPEAEALTDKIADWRDRDNLRRLNGAEAGEYRAANKEYEPTNQPFATVDELRLVLDVTAELYARVSPVLTVYTTKRGVDLRAAPGRVLNSVMKGNKDAVAAFLEARRQADTQALNASMQNFGISRRFVSSSSKSVFTIRASVETDAGARFVREAVVRLARNRAQPFTILAWRRGRN